MRALPEQWPSDSIVLLGGAIRTPGAWVRERGVRRHRQGEQHPNHRHEPQAGLQRHRLQELQVDELLGLLPPSRGREDLGQEGGGDTNLIGKVQGQACRHLAG